MPLLLQESSLTLQTEAGSHWDFCLESKSIREKYNASCPQEHSRSKASIAQTESWTFGSSVDLPGSDPQGCSVNNSTKANAQTGIRLLFTKKTFFTLISNLKQIQMNGFFRKISALKKQDRKLIFRHHMGTLNLGTILLVIE